MKNIYLRPLIETDITEPYLENFKDDEVLLFLEVTNTELTKKSVTAYIKNGLDTKTYYMYAICLIENDQHIGNLKIGPINNKQKISDLVTVIWNKAYWGKGLASEAIKIGNKLAFEKHNIRKLSGGMYSDNIGSIKAYTRAGWVIEATLKNHYMLNGKLQDRVVVSCFNPSYFDE
ncbi:GNAT family N-acetyltransferase [Pseudoalteromonas sp. C12FD-1]|uniref:GNAT family N-acetyltransferase n=1 Tax=Pseudoalteromonas sp. C12FD-1 TaxID=3131979 RepID=UPI00307FC61B